VVTQSDIEKFQCFKDFRRVESYTECSAGDNTSAEHFEVFRSDLLFGYMNASARSTIGGSENQLIDSILDMTGTCRFDVKAYFMLNDCTILTPA